MSSTYDDHGGRGLEIRISPPIEEAQTGSESKVRALIERYVLPKAALRAKHLRAQVEIRRAADGSPEYLVVCMLRAQTYTADVFRVNVDREFRFISLEEDYVAP